MLVVAGEAAGAVAQSRRPGGFPMILFFALFIAIFVRVSRWEQDEAVCSNFACFPRKSSTRYSPGSRNRKSFLHSWRGPLAGRHRCREPISRHLVQNLLQRFPTIQAVKWAPQIRSAQRDGLRGRPTGGLAGLRDPRSRCFRATAARWRTGALYYPVTYVEPLKRQRAHRRVRSCLGARPQDRGGGNARYRAVRATPPIRLVQEQGEQAGILLIFAVQDGPNGPGVVSVALRMGTFMIRSLWLRSLRCSTAALSIRERKRSCTAAFLPAP